jgi:NADH:ubiquinone reductase (H+-translocating)
MTEILQDIQQSAAQVARPPTGDNLAIPNSPEVRRKRVVIVGAGFAGIAAARALKRCDADIFLVDRRNHHIFQPLLYQVATAVLAPSDIAAPIRQISEKQKNVTVLLAE